MTSSSTTRDLQTYRCLQCSRAFSANHQPRTVWRTRHHNCHSPKHLFPSKPLPFRWRTTRRMPQYGSFTAEATPIRQSRHQGHCIRLSTTVVRKLQMMWYGMGKLDQILTPVVKPLHLKVKAILESRSRCLSRPAIELYHGFRVDSHRLSPPICPALSQD